MPLMDGIEATRALRPDRERSPEDPRRDHVRERDAHQALRAGADGFLLKRARPAEIVHAVRLVAEGESLLFPASVRQLAAEYGDGGGNPAARAAMERAALTEREAEALRLMARGCRTRRSPGGSSSEPRRSSRTSAPYWRSRSPGPYRGQSSRRTSRGSWPPAETAVRRWPKRPVGSKGGPRLSPGRAAPSTIRPTRARAGRTGCSGG